MNVGIYVGNKHTLLIMRGNMIGHIWSHEKHMRSHDTHLLSIVQGKVSCYDKDSGNEKEN